MVTLLIKDNYEPLNIDILGEGRRMCPIDKLCITCVYTNTITKKNVIFFSFGSPGGIILHRKERKKYCAGV